MARLLFGLALMPTAVFTAVVGVQALGALTTNAPAAWPFLSGLVAVAVVWVFGRYLMDELNGPIGIAASLTRRLYVLGHETTHALAAWSFGAKVLGFKAGEHSGHVDLSHSNAVIALAPYCVPIYTILVVAAYRALLWYRPGTGGRELFLFLLGGSFAFHLLKTFETIWDREQPDLPAAGGVVFSLSWIVLANGFVMLALVKILFPGAVDFGGGLRSVAFRSGGFWKSCWRFVAPIKDSFVAQMRKP